MSYQPGEIILDKYRIEALLGQGAFGEVYRVTHLRLGVLRALKVLRRDSPGIGSSDFIEIQGRFLLEAQLGAQLNTPTPHPNLLQIHDFNRSGDLLALEMEYAPGGSLIERLQKSREIGQPLPVIEAVAIAADVATGLALLHSRDIVHRDLKPGNILFDNQRRAKVADLGLAQVPGGPSMRSQLSQPLPHPGTPAYKSPEQESSGNYLTAASDVYALGAVLFEMLTGRLYRNLRPGTRASSLRPDTPGWLDDLLANMLSVDLAKRPWDGQEMQTLLREGDGAARAKAQAESKERARLKDEEQKQETAVLAKAWQEAEKRQQQVIAQAKIREEAEENERREAEEGKHAGLILELAPGVSMEFVRVPAGEFWMGSDPKIDKQAKKDEQPQHRVRLDEYLIGKTPVTNRQYQVFVEASGHQKPKHWIDGKIPSRKEQHPVEYVSWEDAQAFCAWAGLKTGAKVRLPTEAEWEKAARGADGRIFPWGDQMPDSTICNFSRNAKDTTPVGRYSPKGDSPCGCVDMAGNVWEWVNDWYDPAYYANSPSYKPTGLASGKSRVLRGGSWDFDEYGVRSAFRDGDNPGNRDYGVGFRCARSLP
jgi:formylglycine-generating enzyme required for sulfatase activity